MVLPSPDINPNSNFEDGNIIEDVEMQNLKEKNGDDSDIKSKNIEEKIDEVDIAQKMNLGNLEESQSNQDEDKSKLSKPSESSMDSDDNNKSADGEMANHNAFAPKVDKFECPKGKCQKVLFVAFWPINLITFYM